MSKWGFVAFCLILFFALANTVKAEGWYINDGVSVDDTNPYDKHIVQKGDTLWMIAGWYHCDFDDLLELNSDLENPNLIYPNDVIKIPLARVEGVYLPK